MSSSVVVCQITRRAKSRLRITTSDLVCSGASDSGAAGTKPNGTFVDGSVCGDLGVDPVSLFGDADTNARTF